MRRGLYWLIWLNACKSRHFFSINYVLLFNLLVCAPLLQKFLRGPYLELIDRTCHRHSPISLNPFRGLGSFFWGIRRIYRFHFRVKFYFISCNLNFFGRSLRYFNSEGLAVRNQSIFLLIVNCKALFP